MLHLTSQQLFDSLQQGGVLLTGNDRLRRALAEDFDRLQAESGLRAWEPLTILSWQAWLRSRWPQAAESIFDERRLPPLLLSPEQDQLLWRQVIDARALEHPLLDAYTAAGEVRKAWRLLHDWRPEITSEEWQSTTDSAVFSDWTSEYRRELKRQNWIDEAQLIDEYLRLQPSAWLDASRAYFLIGIEELTPAQSVLINRLRRSGINITQVSLAGKVKGKPVAMSLADADDELRHAAAWALDLVNSGETGRIGIAIPGLNEKSRLRVERLFTEVIHPESAGEPDAPLLFNISAGRILNSYPVIDAALALLEVALGSVRVETISRLVRSPFLAHGEAERFARARLDYKIRESGALRVSLDRLIQGAHPAPQFQQLLRSLRNEQNRLPAKAHPSEWAISFGRLLHAAGWPGERVRNSAEFQTITRWEKLLETFAALDLVSSRLTLKEATDTLTRLAEQTIFQPAAPSAPPIQVLGLLETSGLVFEHLWVTGLTDEAWPAPASPNPFLPLAAQRRHNLPHSSPARELEFARQTMDRLVRQSRFLTLSYPLRELDRALYPSTLITASPSMPLVYPPPVWNATLRQSCTALEAIPDNTAPPISDGYIRGGSYLLRDFAACPFRAYVNFRLSGRDAEKLGLGLNAKDRGKLVHSVLQALWSELKDSTQLNHPRLHEVIENAVSISLGELEARSAVLTPAMRQLEHDRLVRLVGNWLELEGRRRPFSVVATESKRSITVSGLEFEVKIDRIDSVDGRQVILDYKTGQVNARSWEGDRPDEPQMPLYAAHHDGPVAALAFAGLKKGKLQFEGLSAEADLLPDVKAVDLQSAIAGWKAVIEQLVQRLRAGDASVDPKPKGCEYCRVKPICRVQENIVAAE